MKTIFVFLSFLPFIAYSQTVDDRIDDGTAMMRDVIEVEGTTMKELHDKVDRWIKEYYHYPDEVTVVNEPDLIRIRESAYTAQGVSCKCSTEWEFKDGRVRLTLSNYDCIGSYGNFDALNGMRKKNGKIKMGYASHHDWLVKSFETKVSAITSNASDNDW